MLSKIDTELSFVRTALDLRARRQELLAANIANSDTPNYKARDVNFSAALHSAMAAGSSQGAMRMARTDGRHLSGDVAPGDVAGRNTLYRSAVQPSLDGNTVDIDVERAHFAENSLHYQFMLDRAQGLFRDMALAIQPIGR